MAIQSFSDINILNYIIAFNSDQIGPLVMRNLCMPQPWGLLNNMK
jgi:hypothetical protein